MFFASNFHTIFYVKKMGIFGFIFEIRPNTMLYLYEIKNLKIHTTETFYGHFPGFPCAYSAYITFTTFSRLCMIFALIRDVQNAFLSHLQIILVRRNLLNTTFAQRKIYDYELTQVLPRMIRQNSFR